MRVIFSRADLVYMWLGPSSDDVDRVMDFISRVGPRAFASGVLDSKLHGRPGQEVHDYIKTRPPSNEVDTNDDTAGSELARFYFDLLHERGLYAAPQGGLLTGIVDLLQRDYWHRIWIIQEVALAKDAVVMCGDRSVSLDMFDATFTAVWACKTSGIFNLHPEYHGYGARLLSNMYGTSKPLITRSLRRRRDQIRLADILVELSAAPKRPFYTASDPRDIVFGLLGVIDDRGKLGLRADYSMALVEVFSVLTRALIREGNESSRRFDLDLCVPRREKADNLPTWVSDWRVVGKYGIRSFPINHYHAFDATVGIPPPLLATNNVDCINFAVLRRPGCRVDVIKEVMPPPKRVQYDEWQRSQIADANGWLSAVFNFAGLGPETSPGEDYVWRTIMCHKLRKYGQITVATSEDIAWLIRRIMRRERVDISTLTEDQVEFIRRGLYDLSRAQPKLQTLRDQLAYVVHEWPEYLGAMNRDRTLFKTMKGMFGLGHVAIRAGDVVTLLWGVRSPIILRPRECVGFELVGDAYVDGIMHGEFLDTKPTEREFDIY
ncbi:hypothetical protein QBC46DRAFT_388075 [Diplogelasinospora grovesii]|uniref:Heterokaryon incompatibility domain-containing protein n=1 Tax=Diplogelasinospora grovesii TaxID=303347 RepID=A0AAN6S360_9PEZI|nr:hypothetical protein QBC46DRAFT_388075 [Diplogelasinospora grovesii]